VISGTPTVVTSSASYTITVTNSAGSSTAAVTLSVSVGVPTISYASATGTNGSYGALMTVTPTTLTANGASVTACASSPTLPAWASISATTCVISGTPTGTLSATTYTITATNSAGASSGATVSLSVGAGVPTISYSGATGTSGTAASAMSVSPTTLSSNGASVTACSSSPTLPTGLTISSTTCVISGTPTGALTASSYSITATNSAGTSAAATVSLSITPYVAPVWATNGANWMDYVINVSTQKISQIADTACLGSEAGWKGCLHGGEYRKVVILSETSCTSLLITDTLGVFDWVCDDSSGTQVVFYSIGLKKGKGLRDLIKTDGTAWNQNRVTITGGQSTYQSALSSTWWTNTLTALTTNGTADAAMVSLSTSGTIYYLTSASGNTNTNGYYINANKVGLVTLGSSKLVYGSNTANGNNCKLSTATTTTPDGKYMLCGASRNFVWIEASLDTNYTSGSYASNAFVFKATNFLRFNQTTVVSSAVFTSMTLTGITAAKTTGFYASNGNAANRVLFAINGSGMLFQDFKNAYPLTNMNPFGITGNDIIFHRYKYSNASGGPFTTAAGNKEIHFVESLISSVVGSNAITLTYGDYTTFVGTTVASSFNGGYINLNLGTGVLRPIMHNFLYMSNGGKGLSQGATAATISQFANMNNSQNGIFSLSGTGKWTGNFITGNNGAGGDCISTASSTGTGSGIYASSGSSCGVDNTSTSNVNIISGKTSVGANVGALSTNDSSNTSVQTAAQATFSNTLDWFNFDNPWRSWNRCTSGTCTIYDYSLKTKAAASTVVFQNSESGTTTLNNTPVADAACPTEVRGSNYLSTSSYTYNTDIAGGMTSGVNGYDVSDNNFTLKCAAGNTCEQRYLKDAIELIGAVDTDPTSSTFGQVLGDGDGLCEAGEACLYTPNFGGYQGHSTQASKYTLSGTREFSNHGDLAKCTFSANSGVPSVKMYFYENNGY